MRRSGSAVRGGIVILAVAALCGVAAIGLPPPPVRLGDFAGLAGHLRMVAAAAHTPGLEGTTWLTDLELHNPQSTPASGFLFFLRTGEDNSDAVGVYFAVDAGASLGLADVVASTFGESKATGAIMIGSDAELVVTSRTFNDDDSGTYGQYVEGYAVGSASSTEGGRATLIQLTENAAFRTNLGLVNAGSEGLYADVDFYRSDGGRLGSKRYWVGSFMHVQDVKVLTTVTSGDVDDGYAVVTTSTPGARFFAYASVADNRTGDPTQVVPGSVSSGVPLYLPGAARVGGYGGTAWRTDLEVHNPGGSQARFTAELLRRDAANTAPAQRSFSLDGGRSVRYVDVLASVFGTEGAATLRLTPTQGEITAVQRTYNDQPAGTHGQFVAGLPEDAAVAYGQTARLVQLSQSASDTSGFRTNLGLVSTVGVPVAVTAELYQGDGVKLGSRSYQLPAYGYQQDDKVFRTVTADAVDDGYAVLYTTTAEGRFFAYASVVDARSGDPVTIPARVTSSSPCGYAVVPTGRSHGAGEEDGSFAVEAPAGCAWTAAPSASWVMVTAGASGSGNGTVSYRLEANSGTAARSATIEVPGPPPVGSQVAPSPGGASATFTVTQAGAEACTYVLSPAGRSHGAGEETGGFTVSAPVGCSWAANRTALWIEVTEGLSGSGNGTVSYRVDANEGADRTAGIVVHGVPFSVAQAGAQEITVMLPGGVPLAMVRVPAGTFLMGSPATERGRDAGPFALDETLHQVTLTQDYYMGRTEVTQRQWRAVMGSSPPTGCRGFDGSYGVGNDYPAYCISWNDVCGGASGASCEPASFIGRLNAFLGTTEFRLPTEAEWEYAARAGTTTRFSHGDVLECDDECGACGAHAAAMWWCGNAGDTSHPVGRANPNPWGLHDVHGNVWELVSDWYGPYPSSAVVDPVGPAAGPGRVGRGGDWDLGAAWCRSAQRGYSPPEDGFHIVGFRLARSR